MNKKSPSPKTSGRGGRAVTFPAYWKRIGVFRYRLPQAHHAEASYCPWRAFCEDAVASHARSRPLSSRADNDQSHGDPHRLRPCARKERTSFSWIPPFSGLPLFGADQELERDSGPLSPFLPELPRFRSASALDPASQRQPQLPTMRHFFLLSVGSCSFGSAGQAVHFPKLGNT